MSAPSLLILAAGIGSRYGGFKQIDPIGPDGEIIIDYSVHDALRAGFGRIVIVTAPELEEPIREHFRQTLGDRFDLAFAFQEPGDLPDGFTLPPERKKPWGTAHAIRAARHHLRGPFGVINADDFYGARSYRVLHDFLAGPDRDGQYAMVGFELAKTLSRHGTVSRGICRADADGHLADVVEHTTIEPDLSTEPAGARTLSDEGNWQPIAADSIASMNLWGLDSSVFGHLENAFSDFLKTRIEEPKSEFFIPTVIDGLIKAGTVKCKVLKSDEQWFGVTYREDRDLAAAAIRELVKSGVYPQSLRDPQPR